MLSRIKNPSKSPFTKGDFRFLLWKLIMRHISLAIHGEKVQISGISFFPFGKGGSRGICLSGGEVFWVAEPRFFGELEQREGKKSPLAPPFD